MGTNQISPFYFWGCIKQEFDWLLSGETTQIRKGLQWGGQLQVDHYLPIDHGYCGAWKIWKNLLALVSPRLRTTALNNNCTNKTYVL